VIVACPEIPDRLDYLVDSSDNSCNVRQPLRNRKAVVAGTEVLRTGRRLTIVQRRHHHDLDKRINLVSVFLSEARSNAIIVGRY
jgi:hypothetical protein